MSKVDRAGILPVHASKLIWLINIQFKPHLNDPFHLAEFGMVSPRRQWESPELFARGLGINNGGFLSMFAELYVKILGLTCG